MELGKRYKDTATGFAGIATAKHEYIGGYESTTLEAVDTDGKPIRETFDNARLVAE